MAVQQILHLETYLAHSTQQSYQEGEQHNAVLANVLQHNLEAQSRTTQNRSCALRTDCRQLMGSVRQPPVEPRSLHSEPFISLTVELSLQAHVA
jgi:hypothetical protein